MGDETEEQVVVEGVARERVADCFLRAAILRKVRGLDAGNGGASDRTFLSTPQWLQVCYFLVSWFR